MNEQRQDLLSQARTMAASAKCLEVFAPLTTQERRQVILGLVLSTLDEDSPRDQRIVQDLLSKMAEEVKR